MVKTDVRARQKPPAQDATPASRAGQAMTDPPQAALLDSWLSGTIRERGANQETTDQWSTLNGAPTSGARSPMR